MSALVDAGPPSQVAMDDLLEVRVPDHNLNICRDANGLYAMSANCTHARCIVTFASPAQGDPTLGFYCTCHGSTFDYNGEHNTAPAPRPLEHYQLAIDAGGNMIVDTSQIVAAGQRTKS